LERVLAHGTAANLSRLSTHIYEIKAKPKMRLPLLSCFGNNEFPARWLAARFLPLFRNDPRGLPIGLNFR
jgi:hypothetical protein